MSFKLGIVFAVVLGMAADTRMACATGISRSVRGYSRWLTATMP
jgi:hypothetical protein